MAKLFLVKIEIKHYFPQFGNNSDLHPIWLFKIQANKKWNLLTFTRSRGYHTQTYNKDSLMANEKSNPAIILTTSETS